MTNRRLEPCFEHSSWHRSSFTYVATILSFALACVTGSSAAIAQEAASEDALNFFESKIRPVLVTHCYECHAADSKLIQGGLRLDDRESILKGGDTGPAVVVDHPNDSLLIKALRYEGPEMPPKEKLPASVVADFERWIAMGLPDPRKAAAPKETRTIDIEEGRKHWAFQPVRDVSPPVVSDAAWPLDPIDHFVLASLEQHNLRPVADADRYTWLRRVTLDLTGLTPSPAEIEAFTNDQSPGAFETVVDRLLASRAYGERWARHWLDMTGYADQMGTSNEVFAEHAWRYRDYLIDSFNSDKPFDEFLIEQIAGDLLPGRSPEERASQIVATGFLMVGDVEIVNPDKLKLETDHIDLQLSKIGTVFMGMTLGCVRCHDHKFDPIGLSDYYAMAGTLRSSVSTVKVDHGIWSGLNVVELPESESQRADREAKMVAHRQRMDQLSEEERKLRDELGMVNAELEKPEAKKDELTKRRDAIQGRLQQIPGERQHAEFFAPKVPRAFAIQDAVPAADMAICVRGNPYAPGKVVPRGVMRVASWDDGPTMPKHQSGRLQLAEWLADPKHPLTSRVTVNRIWQKLFGEGLVRSVDYFGTRGEQPTHPELLDHLSTQFVKHGWSQKKLIRSIVLSHAYRVGSQPNPQAMATDPENRLLWRMNPQRLDAESLRDSMLAASGELQACAGGPALPLEFPENTGNLAPKAVNPPSFALRRYRPE
ncbi:MAG: DUF1549 domain-containing protein, partial [Planctomycetaceae bacterium]|nr:DUF1549 domain-containing protein [Planctomycetaceae bacterium]